MNQKRSLRKRVSPEEYQLLQQLRERRPAQNPPKQRLSLGDRISDKVAAIMGSWRFIIIQSILLAFWVILNVIAVIQHWDPYPFILLNLMLSFQAAYAAPIIMMSQNRQAAIDRADARHDYEVNQKAELEIEVLQDKLNLLREEEIAELKMLLIEQQQVTLRLETLLIEQLQK
ncbi:MAG: DUF1003 domain-containing protein [Thermosynechococcaceae cyanobacterium MS004]|nr:DUF1003 domain-containing protein [Thermosynechococcaceae cyanobacterium MS004]